MKKTIVLLLSFVFTCCTGNSRRATDPDALARFFINELIAELSGVISFESESEKIVWIEIEIPSRAGFSTVNSSIQRKVGQYSDVFWVKTGRKNKWGFTSVASPSKTNLSWYNIMAGKGPTKMPPKFLFFSKNN